MIKRRLHGNRGLTPTALHWYAQTRWDQERKTEIQGEERSICKSAKIPLLNLFLKGWLFLLKLLQNFWEEMALQQALCAQAYTHILSYSVLLKTTDLLSLICMMFTMLRSNTKTVAKSSKLNCRFSSGLKFTQKSWSLGLKSKVKIS